MLKKSIFIFSVVFVIGYGIYRTIPLFLGVNIDITYDVAHLQEDHNTLVIRGNVLHAKSATLNGQTITLSPEGDFTEILALAPGINKNTIQTQDVRGKIKTKEFTIVAPLLD